MELNQDIGTKKTHVSRLHQLSTPKHRKNVSGAISFAQVFQYNNNNTNSTNNTNNSTPLKPPYITSNKNIISSPITSTSYSSSIPTPINTSQTTSSSLSTTIVNNKSSNEVRSLSSNETTLPNSIHNSSRSNHYSSSSHSRPLWKIPEKLQTQETIESGKENDNIKISQVQSSKKSNQIVKRDSFSVARSKAIRDMIKNFGSEAKTASKSSFSQVEDNQVTNSNSNSSSQPSQQSSITSRFNDLAIPKYKSAKVISSSSTPSFSTASALSSSSSSSSSSSALLTSTNNTHLSSTSSAIPTPINKDLKDFVTLTAEQINEYNPIKETEKNSKSINVSSEKKSIPIQSKNSSSSSSSSKPSQNTSEFVDKLKARCTPTPTTTTTSSETQNNSKISEIHGKSSSLSMDYQYDGKCSYYQHSQQRQQSSSPQSQKTTLNSENNKSLGSTIENIPSRNEKNNLYQKYSHNNVNSSNNNNNYYNYNSNNEIGKKSTSNRQGKGNLPTNLTSNYKTGFKIPNTIGSSSPSSNLLNKDENEINSQKDSVRVIKSVISTSSLTNTSNLISSSLSNNNNVNMFEGNNIKLIQKNSQTSTNTNQIMKQNLDKNKFISQGNRSQFNKETINNFDNFGTTNHKSSSVCEQKNVSESIQSNDLIEFSNSTLLSSKELELYPHTSNHNNSLHLINSNDQSYSFKSSTSHSQSQEHHNHHHHHYHLSSDSINSNSLSNHNTNFSTNSKQMNLSVEIQDPSLISNLNSSSHHSNLGENKLLSSAPRQSLSPPNNANNKPDNNTNDNDNKISTFSDRQFQFSPSNERLSNLHMNKSNTDANLPSYTDFNSQITFKSSNNINEIVASNSNSTSNNLHSLHNIVSQERPSSSPVFSTSSSLITSTNSSSSSTNNSKDIIHPSSESDLNLSLFLPVESTQLNNTQTKQEIEKLIISTPDLIDIDEKQSAAAIQLRNARRRFRQSSQNVLTRKWPLRGSSIVKIPDDPSISPRFVSPRLNNASSNNNIQQNTNDDNLSNVCLSNETTSISTSQSNQQSQPVTNSDLLLSPTSQPQITLPLRSCMKKHRSRVVTIGGVSMIRRVKFDNNVQVEYFEGNIESEVGNNSNNLNDDEINDKLYRPMIPKIKINYQSSTTSSTSSSSMNTNYPPRNIEEALEQSKRERESLYGNDGDENSVSDESTGSNSQILYFSKERFIISDFMTFTTSIH